MATLSPHLCFSAVHDCYSGVDDETDDGQLWWKRTTCDRNRQQSTSLTIKAILPKNTVGSDRSNNKHPNSRRTRPRSAFRQNLQRKHRRYFPRKRQEDQHLWNPLRRQFGSDVLHVRRSLPLLDVFDRRGNHRYFENFGHLQSLVRACFRRFHCRIGSKKDKT